MFPLASISGVTVKPGATQLFDQSVSRRVLLGFLLAALATLLIGAKALREFNAAIDPAKRFTAGKPAC